MVMTIVHGGDKWERTGESCCHANIDCKSSISVLLSCVNYCDYHIKHLAAHSIFLIFFYFAFCLTDSSENLESGLRYRVTLLSVKKGIILIVELRWMYVLH